jgi:hypothetical protein
MVYFGRVLRNSNFGETGRLEVLLGQRNFFGSQAKENDMKELKERVDSIPLILGKRKSGADSRTVRCMLVSSMANSPNAGMLQIPQVGSVGLVLEVVNEYDVWPNDVEYFWLAGLWGLTQYPGFIEKDAKVSLPNDDTVSEEVGSSNVSDDKKLYTEVETDSGNIKGSPYFSEGQFILKTKTCDVPDAKKASKVDYDFDKIPGENTFVLNKEKCTLRHNLYEGEQGNKKHIGIEQIVFEPKKTKLLRRIKNDGENFEQYVRFDKDGTEIFNNNIKNGHQTKINFKDNGDIIVYTTHDNNVLIKGRSDIRVDGDSTVSIGGNSDVTIEGTASVTSYKDMSVTSGGKLDVKSAEICTVTAPTLIVTAPPTIVNGHLMVT